MSSRPTCGTALSHGRDAIAFSYGHDDHIGGLSAGLENSYGHRNREVLNRLVQRGAAALRGDFDGMVTIRSDRRPGGTWKRTTAFSARNSGEYSV
jgi:beta-lactamase superfamily II metal-dependent hydrolase